MSSHFNIVFVVKSTVEIAMHSNNSNINVIKAAGLGGPAA